MNEIREWVDAGKTDDWIADALGTSASSVQSFRSRNDIYRRERLAREPESVFEGVLDKGERDGWGLWLDPSVADDPIWREYWSNVDSVVVKVAEDAIVLEADREASTDVAGDVARLASVPTPKSVPDVATRSQSAPGPHDGAVAAEAPVVGSAVAEPSAAEPSGDGELSREQGRVKWFDADKGYGFLIRPTGEDLFVHHSEVEGDASDLGPNGEVEYDVGRNDRGPNARRVRILA